MMASVFLYDMRLDLETDDIVVDYDAHLNDDDPIGAIVQRVHLRLTLIRGEWFLNLAEGVPYFERAGVVAESDVLLGQKYNQEKLIRALREEIEAVDGIIEVVYISSTFNPATRTAQVRWQVRTDYGVSDDQVTEL